MRDLRFNWPLAGLGGIAAALVILIIFELLPDTPTLTPVQAPTHSSARLEPTASHPQQSEATLIATALSRPLFNPDRKPDKIDEPTQTASASASGDLPRLAGILVDGEARRAVFQTSADEAPVVVAEGATIDGWKIDQITPAAINLSGPEGKKTLQPVFDPNAKPADPALPPAEPKPVNGAANRQPGQPPFDPRRFQRPGAPMLPGMPGRPNMMRPMPPGAAPRPQQQRPDNQ